MIKKLGTCYFILSLDISRFTEQTVKLFKARKRIAEKITATKFSMFIFVVNAYTSYRLQYTMFDSDSFLSAQSAL